MRGYNKSYSLEQVLLRTKNRQPDFNNLLKVLRREKPDRPTLFEFFLNDALYERLTGMRPEQDFTTHLCWVMEAYRNAGYDYLPLPCPWGFGFVKKEHERQKSISLNDGALITDWASFHQYPWPDPTQIDRSVYEAFYTKLIPGMKGILYGPSGVLENSIGVLGYDNLCFLLVDAPDLVDAVFNKVGTILHGFYERLVDLPVIGAAIVNDDWGFNTQTMLSVHDMRRLVIPWHKRIVEAIHGARKPAILHSCGQLEKVMEDIVHTIGFDAKHSYEDKIQPVEQAYDQWSPELAILGGIDVHFVCTEAPEIVYKRSKAMLEKTGGQGYALGTGNSVPDYVPETQYYAMVLAALG